MLQHAPLTVSRRLSIWFQSQHVQLNIEREYGQARHRVEQQCKSWRCRRRGHDVVKIYQNTCVRIKKRTVCIAFSVLPPDLEVPTPDFTHCSRNACYHPPTSIFFLVVCPSYKGPPPLCSTASLRVGLNRKILWTIIQNVQAWTFGGHLWTFNGI